MSSDDLDRYAGRNTLEVERHIGFGFTAGFPPFDENWPVILAAVRELESLGICQTGVSPSHIAP